MGDVDRLKKLQKEEEARILTQRKQSNIHTPSQVTFSDVPKTQEKESLKATEVEKEIKFKHKNTEISRRKRKRKIKFDKKIEAEPDYSYEIAQFFGKAFKFTLMIGGGVVMFMVGKMVLDEVITAVEENGVAVSSSNVTGTTNITTFLSSTELISFFPLLIAGVVMFVALSTFMRGSRRYL